MKTSRSKRLIALMLALACVIATFPMLCGTAQAKNTESSPYNEGVYRIRYAANNRYLDIPSEGFNENGTQLQIWDYDFGNQNQIFILRLTDLGWCICATNGRMIEVRDSRHDDFAPVAQWDAHSGKCAHWYIRENGDGTVSFRNMESGKYLNVCGGNDAHNGTEIIQYYDDDSIAMRFYLERLTYTDVLSASYTRNIQASELEWSYYRPILDEIYNFTGLNFQNQYGYYYPTVGQQYFYSKEYLSPAEVATLIKMNSYNASTKMQIRSALLGELGNDALKALLDFLGINSGNFYGLNGDFLCGKGLAILQILYDREDSERWNAFLDAAQINKQGQYSGVIVTTYYYIADYPTWQMLPYDMAMGWVHNIRKVPRVTYSSWTGDNFADVKELLTDCINGNWTYTFK